MLYGQNSLLSFMGESKTEMGRSGSFYWNTTRPSPDSTKADLSQEAAIWLNGIIDGEPACGRESALRDLMLLITEKMLVVNLPDQSDTYQLGRRASAKVVSDELQAILKKCEDPAYLFPELDRRHVLPPSPGDSRMGAGIRPAEAHSIVQKQALSPAPRQFGDTLKLPGSSSMNTTAGSTTIVRQQQYTHPMTDQWSCEDDDTYATSTLQKLESRFQSLVTSVRDAGSKVCGLCRVFDPIHAKTFKPRLLQDLERGGKNCHLCKTIGKRACEAGLKKTDTIAIDRQGSRLRINGRDGAALRV
jgi:hypothetical protein